jgi:hypothetical protein
LTTSPSNGELRVSPRRALKRASEGSSTFSVHILPPTPATLSPQMIFRKTTVHPAGISHVGHSLARETHVPRGSSTGILTWPMLQKDMALKRANGRISDRWCRGSATTGAGVAVGRSHCARGGPKPRRVEEAAGGSPDLAAAGGGEVAEWTIVGPSA